MSKIFLWFSDINNTFKKDNLNFISSSGDFMNVIYKLLKFSVVISVFIIMHSSAAASVPNDSSSGIEQAKKLYAQASPMAISSPERSRLLNEATEILKNVIKQNPKSLDAHRKLMGVYLLKQDYSNAIRTMQSAITLSPDDPKLFISLAFLYEHSGALELAKGMLGQALKLDPDNKIAQDYKLVIQQKIDQFNAAHEQAHGSSPHAGSAAPHGASPHVQTGTGSKLIDSKLMESKATQDSGK